MNASLVIGQPDFVTKTPSIGKSGLKSQVVAFDPTGNLWVAEYGNNRLLEFQSPFSTGMAASLVIGQQDFTTYTKATTQYGFLGVGIPGFDSSGNLWAVDPGNNRVLEFSSSGSSVTSTTPPSTQTTPSSATSTQSSQTSVPTTTTTQALGQLPYIAAGAAIVFVAVVLIAVFLIRSRRKSGATQGST